MYLVQIIYSSKYSSAFRNDPLLAFWGDTFLAFLNYYITSDIVDGQKKGNNLVSLPERYFTQ